MFDDYLNAAVFFLGQSFLCSSWTEWVTINAAWFLASEAVRLRRVRGAVDVVSSTAIHNWSENFFACGGVLR